MAFTVDRAFELMAGAYERRRLAHAFLISGAPGCGKEHLAARLITRLQDEGGGTDDFFGDAVPAEVRPLDELAADRVQILRPKSKSRVIRIDEIREFERRIHQSVGPNSWRVGVIVDADRLNPAATNAFLKTLEEPPARTLLLLLSANPDSLLPTVVSRCVRIPLMGGLDLSNHGGGELVEALNTVGETGFGSVEAALCVKARFADILAARKAAADKAADSAFKAEEKHLKGAVEGDWLKQREKEFESMARAEYLNARNALFGVLECWFGDILRARIGAEGLDFPDHAGLSRRLGEGRAVDELLRRMEAIDELRQALDTNAQEQLALDTGFIEAFA